MVETDSGKYLAESEHLWLLRICKVLDPVFPKDHLNVLESFPVPAAYVDGPSTVAVELTEVEVEEVDGVLLAH